MVKQLTVVWILGTLLSHTASAHPKKVKQQRAISLRLDDPRRSFAANSAAWQALNQAIALGIDELDESLFADNSLLSRAALFTTGLWTNAMLRFYSHEIAHEYAYRAKDVPFRNSLDWQNWTSSTIPGLYYPDWHQSPLDPNVLSEDELVSATVAGLNQDECNAAAAWRLSFARESLSFYDAQSFLLTKLRDIDYIIRSGSDEKPFAPGRSLHQLQRAVHAEAPHLFDDVNLYRLALANDGVRISNQQLLNRALLADALSWHTWQSAWSLISYLAKGEKSIQPALPVGDDLHFTPPLFSHYLTRGGSFINSSYGVRIHDKDFRIDIGSMIGFAKLEPFRHYRFGLQSFVVALMPRWSAQPYLFLNGHAGLAIKGYSLGLDHAIAVSQTVAITAKIEYNKDDILESIVKREKNGLRSVAGIRATF